MAAAEILATGTTHASSSDSAVTTTTLTVALKEYASDAKVDIELKDDAGAYWKVGSLSAANPMEIVSAPGTYRFTRHVGDSSAKCGVFSG